MTKSTKSTKSALVLKLLSRERGATVAELVKSTSWKEHSVRAFLTGVRKTATLVKEERPYGSIVYRITADQTAADVVAGVQA
jgi:hypothetical protein